MKKTMCHHKLCGGTGYEHEMYKNSPQQDIFEGLPLPENSGWKVEDSRLSYNRWDLQEKVKGTSEFLT